MTTKFRVSYTVGSQRMACEYETAEEAAYHHQDIAGWEGAGVFDVRTDSIESNEPPNRGPFSLMVPEVQTRFTREEVV